MRAVLASLLWLAHPAQGPGPDPRAQLPAAVRGLVGDDWQPVQGDEALRYTYEPLKYSTDTWYGSTFWTGPDWTRVGRDWQHSGTQVSSVRVFRAPRAGRVRVSGHAYKADTKCGDGVVTLVRHNGRTVWRAEIGAADTKGAEHDLTLDLVVDDRVQFVLHRRGEISCDTTYWDPTIAYETGEAFRASEGFSDKPGVWLPPFAVLALRGCAALTALIALGSDAHMQPEQNDVFASGQEGYDTFRIPAVIVTPKGTVLAFCEGRKNSASDTGDIDLVLKRSFDGGRTWGPLQLIAEDGANTVGNPCPVIDRDTGAIWLPLTHNLGSDAESRIIDQTSEGTRRVWLTKSDDDGATWTKPIDLTDQAKQPNWTWYATGPGVGIQLRRGRLVIPCDHMVAVTKEYRSHVIFSDDHGQTWQIGGTVSPGVNECQVVELPDGALLLNMRNYHQSETNRRAIARSTDEGATWSALSYDAALIEPICQASFLRYDDRRLLFSNPASSKREKMTVRLSRDEGRTWSAECMLHRGPAAYSCLTVLPDITIGCLYECGDEHPYQRIRFARLGVETLAGEELGA